MLEGKDLKKYCALGSSEQALMERAFTAMGMTARTYHRVIRTARTIADLDRSEQIKERHLKEAIGYRMIDRRYWGR